MKNEKKNAPLTLEDYQARYGKGENQKTAKGIARLLIAAIGLIIATCLFFLCVKLFDYHPIAGYVGIGVSVLLFVFLFLVPSIQILKTGYFMVDVSEKNAKAAQKHNRAIRKDIAKKIIDFTEKVENTKWYDEATVGKLAIALTNNNDAQIKEHLTALYQGSIKKAGQSLIVKASVKSGAYSALSQSALLDTALVSVTNLKMIKDIVFLYGFRPSEARLAKITKTVLANSLIAFGVANANVGGVIVKGISATKDIPFLGTLVDSAVQGLTNGILTSVIGYQTVLYLQKEYHLQDILDGIELTSEEDLTEICAQTKQEIGPLKKKAASAK
ncbi:MAG: YcjF family protein [Bacilli bacterium]|nr:YcjF family protein [Bacilli bacterium]